MKHLNIGIAQVNSTIGDFRSNFEKILSFWEELDSKSELVVFPELVMCGYPPEDLLTREDFIKECMLWAQKLVEYSQKFSSALVFGTPYFKSRLFNALIVAYKGEIIGLYFKKFLPNYSVFDEKRYFASGDSPLLIQVNDVKLGFSVCEDIWHPDGWETRCASAGAEVLISINASPYHIGKFEFKKNFLKARAQDNICYVVYVNCCGAQDELVFDGRSMVISPEGKIIAQLKAFEEEAQVVSIEVSKVTKKRLFDLRLYEKPIQIFSQAKIEIKRKPPVLKTTFEDFSCEEAEVYEALVTGVKNYVEKNGFKSVLIGLSGGIDSSLTACIAVDALGASKVIGVFMPSKFTSKESKEDVKELVKNLGITLYTYPIDEIFEAYERLLSQGKFDVADENVQARIRANILFYLSNRLRALVLSTSNKSESAVGYTTIYGDMAGGFAPLKDVYKTEVYKLARYRNSISPVIPERVFKKPPTAELKENQTDQDTLPPYSILDEILIKYIEEGLSKEELIGLGYEKSTVEKVLKMLKLAEFKRKQAPLGPKIHLRAFGKDWRMPITNHYF